MYRPTASLMYSPSVSPLSLPPSLSLSLSLSHTHTHTHTQSMEPEFLGPALHQKVSRLYQRHRLVSNCKYTCMYMYMYIITHILTLNFLQIQHHNRTMSAAAAELMYIKLAQQLPEYGHEPLQEIVSTSLTVHSLMRLV